MDHPSSLAPTTATVITPRMIGVLQAHAQHATELTLQMPHVYFECGKTSDVVNMETGEMMYQVVRRTRNGLKEGRRGVYILSALLPKSKHGLSRGA